MHPISRQFQVGRSHSNQVLRKQFPIKHASAKTLHRSQGDTLEQVVLDFTGARKQAHIHYVGLSRVKTLNGLFILNLSADKILVSNLVKQEMQRLRTLAALSPQLLHPSSLSNTHWNFSFLNARSLYKHIKDIQSNPWLATCDVQMYCETHLHNYDIQNSNTHFLNDYHTLVFDGMSHTPNTRSHYGLVIYTKQAPIHTFQSVNMSDKNTDSYIEAAVVQFNITDNIVFNLTCAYRRPSKPLHQLSHALIQLIHQITVLQQPDKQYYNIIMGDFNLVWAEDSVKTSMRRLLPTCRQLVNTPTTDYGTTLDHIYTDLPDTCLRYFTTECYFTDHKALICTIDKQSFSNIH